MNHSLVAIAVGVSFLAASAAPPFLAAERAEERLDIEVMAKLRKEGQDNSRILNTLHYLTDVYGPRLTGSPQLKAAGEWAVKEMATWGFANGRLEPWDWGYPGWTNEVAIGSIVSPVKDKLEFEVLAWTPGTDGTVKARAFNLVPPDQPTKEELETYLSGIKDQVQNAIVLVGRSRPVPVNLEPPAKRTPDEIVRGRYNAPPGERGAGGGRAGRGGRGDVPQPREGAMPATDVNQRITDFLLASKVKLRINDAQREHGQIRAFQNNTYDIKKVVPTVVMRNEDYGRVARILANGTPVELQFTIVNKLHQEGKTAYNTISEIPGTRQAGRGRDARRPPRFLALGHRRDRQRDRLRRHDGSRAIDQGDRRAAAADDPRRAVERRGTGPARLDRLRE